MTDLGEAGPSLSVVVPIYSETKDLWNLNTWLTSMTIDQLQVILVIDSPFGVYSPAVLALESYSVKSNIEIYKVNYGSPGLARNEGIVHAESKWVAFWDCDDLPAVDEFLKMIVCAETAKSSVALGQFETINLRRSVVQTSSIEPDFTNRFFSRLALAPGIWRFAFQKQLIQDIKFPKFRMGEDQSFLAEVLNSAPRPYFHNATVYRYMTGGEDQLTGSEEAVLEISHSLQNLRVLRKKGVHRNIVNPMYLTQSYSLAKRSRNFKKLLIFVSVVNFIGVRIGTIFPLGLSYVMEKFKNNRNRWS